MVPEEDAHIIDHFDVGAKQDISTLRYTGNVLSDAQVNRLCTILTFHKLDHFYLIIGRDL